MPSEIMIDARFMQKQSQFDWSIVIQQINLLGYRFKEIKGSKAYYQNGNDIIIVCQPCNNIRHNSIIIPKNKIYDYLKTLVK